MVYFRFLIGVMILFLFESAAVGELDHQKKNLSSKDNVRLGVITLYHPLVMYKNYQPFVDYLSEKTPYTFTLKITEKYNEIIESLQNGTIQAAMLGGMTYVEAAQKASITPLLSALSQKGDPVCQSIFITREDRKDINDLNDIKGSAFAFASVHSTSGNLMPLFYLYSQKNIKRSDFKTTTHLKYHDSVAREVLRGNFDAGVILSTIALQYEDAGLKFIGKTGFFPGFVLVVRKDLSSDITQTIQKVLLGLNYEKESHRKVMDTWDINIRFGFTKASDQDYEMIRKAVHTLSSHPMKVPRP